MTHNINNLLLQNLVEPNIPLTELKLDHNSLEVLNTALSGLSQLLRLDLSHNKLRRISPDDFINLDQLRLLDISHNQLKTLEEMSKVKKSFNTIEDRTCKCIFISDLPSKTVGTKGNPQSANHFGSRFSRVASVMRR